MEQFHSSDIRTFTIVGHYAPGGRGLHSESLSHYQKMPKEFKQKVIQNRTDYEDE